MVEWPLDQLLAGTAAVRNRRKAGFSQYCLVEQGAEAVSRR
jgi:hypothetical protein